MADVGVHFGFDGGDIGGGQRSRVRIVEAEAVGGDEAALLGDMLAEAMAQRGVEEVGGAVIGADPGAAFDVDRLVEGVAGLDAADGDFGVERVKLAERLRRVLNDSGEAVERAQLSGVADLPPALAVEGGLIEEDDDAVALGCLLNAHTVLDQRKDDALAFVARITRELGWAMLLDEVEPQIVGGAFARALPGSTGSGLLRGHALVEAGAVDRETAGAQRVFGQVVGEAEGVVELERGRPGESLALSQRRGCFVEQFQSIDQGAAELDFFLRQRRLDRRLGTDQLRIGGAHLGDERRDEAVHQRLACAEQMGVAHGAAHDPAQDVSPALVGRQHAVGDEEAGCAKMVGDDAVTGLGGALGSRVGQRLALGDQCFENVGVVIVVDALQDGGDPLEPHAGVDRFLGQVADDFSARLLILHEHQVPDLDEAVAVLVGAAGRTAEDVVAVVVEDFGAGPARAVVAHRPEIILGGDADDAVVGEAGNALPQIERLVVGVVDGDRQAVSTEAPFAREQGPGVVDRLFLEVIAEREIAEHFEEGVMARSIADIVEIIVLAASADAFLRRGRGDVGAGL